MQEINEVNQNTALRLAVRAYDDFQRMRVAMGGRIKIKKDKSEQTVPEDQQENWAMTKRDRDFFMGIYDTAYKQEDIIKKHIEKQLRDFSVYTEFLQGVKGVGPVMAGKIIANYNIYEAATVSKMWQYTGLNPGYVYGKKIMSLNDAKKSGFPIVKRYKNKKNENEAIVETDELIRGDKLTKGYVSPFNKDLRTIMCGVLADSFIKAQSFYALEFYYPYKRRLENEPGWKDEIKGHRDRAAKRYMIKQFLKDLYANWRELEGLEVRRPYQEEYLDHQPSRQKKKVQQKPEQRKGQRGSRASQSLEVNH